ncbi:MAG: hypothetical protein JW913_02225 [Chitinispirillaceae bacterium]|nr:hypothetical protein [Chitinispirillaceae bacterium]
MNHHYLWYSLDERRFCLHQCCDRNRNDMYFSFRPPLKQITVGSIGILSLLLFFLPKTLSVAAPGSDSLMTIDSTADSLETSPVTLDSLTGKNSPQPADTGTARPVMRSVTSPLTRDSSKLRTEDSAAILFKRDSLLREESARRLIHYPDSAAVTNRTEASTGDLFRSDATSWYDVPAIKRRAAGPRLGLAGSFNRLLLYGNIAPFTRIYSGTGLLYRTALDPLYGDDASFPTEYSGIRFPGDGTIHFQPHTDRLVSMETAILWETGVFDENILSLRFTRPLARRLILNVFSNYRYFEGMSFSHDGNDIYSFFSKVTPDTALLSHKGYNPLVNEYFCGADAVWSGKAFSSFFRIKYGDLTNEVPMDQKPLDQYLDHARLQQYPLSFQSGFSTQARSRCFFAVEACALSNPHTWTRPVAEGTNIHAEKTKLSSNDLSGALVTGIRIPEKDSVMLQCNVQRRQIKAADSLEFLTFQYRPEFLWNHPLSFSFFKGTVVISAGYDLHTSDAGLVHSPIWAGRVQAQLSNYQLGLYAEQDHIHYAPPTDSLTTGITLHDTYVRTGIEIERNWRLLSLLVGYQWCTAVDTNRVKRAWISGRPPYRQPQSVLIIAPQLGRWHGVTLTSRLMLSKSKPYVKLQSGLSLLAFPKLTREAIDVRLGLDYWSARDSTQFAGRSDWHRPVLDLNFATSVHIKSFRLLYKIDNLLNRNFSYVPGYYAPGITFRWGIGWFIQR